MARFSQPKVYSWDGNQQWKALLASIMPLDTVAFPPFLADSMNVLWYTLISNALKHISLLRCGTLVSSENFFVLLNPTLVSVIDFQVFILSSGKKILSCREKSILLTFRTELFSLFYDGLTSVQCLSSHYNAELPYDRKGSSQIWSCG